MSEGAVSPARSVYPRILLKLSGDTLGRPGETGISVASVESIALQIQNIVKTGAQLAIVIGGGNILRGRALAA